MRDRKEKATPVFHVSISLLFVSALLDIADEKELFVDARDFLVSLSLL